MRWSIYNPKGRCIAKAMHAEDAAMFVGSLGADYTVRNGRTIVWHEGHETISACESFDACADTMIRRAGNPYLRAVQS